MANISTSAVNHGKTQAAQHPTETSSRCVPGSITGAHNFEVTKFSLLDGAMGIGKYVASSPFSVGGYDWNIKFYPDGNGSRSSSSRMEAAPYVSVYLNLIRGAADARAKFNLSLLFKEHQVVSRETTHTFPSTGDDLGWTVFIEKSKLRELVRQSDDRFTIRCVLTVIGDPQIKDDGSIAVPPPKLHQDLSHMLKNGEGADVTFSVGDQLFPAHKCILAARSLVFKAEFFGAMKERDDQCIKIHDMEPAIFEALLHFVYTDSLPNDCGDDADSSNNVAMQHLLVAADRYGLDRLRMMCEAKLCRDIDVETVAITLLLAEQHHCTQLKDACLGFIASRNMLGVVMKTDGFEHLITSCPLVMKEFLDKVAAAGSE